ncbi:hypothetical protein LTR12_003476 [Friedmanniomyces endolithicus]|nr:hypothetical protein LTR12_003476 [Friedmanniomyces endolithicus]
MEEAPPVPLKDTPKNRTMHVDSAPPSGSKRKRSEQDEQDEHDETLHLEPADLDAHTPKRSRQSDAEVSDGTPINQRNLRRKKKNNNLSNLSLRHAAEQQRVRESRFREGSLTDKPSMKPPSAFTRMMRTDSGNIRQVDELMEGYNDDSIDRDVSLGASVRGEAYTPPLGAAFEPAPRAESGGFFRFGRSFATNFHPVTLWNKIWNEARQELIRENAEEAERKRRQKEEAEAKYAEMKAAGQLGLKQVSNNLVATREPEAGARPRDSAVVLDDVKDHTRITTTGSQLLPPPRDDIPSHPGSEVPESKTKHTFKSRFAFKKPSMSNMKGGLKRVASDLNLTAGAGRESSSSISPVKADFDHSIVKRSSSKFDLKKQQKLSKRVSDLESKLQLARRELGDALVEASPNPKLNNKYERFTPHSTTLKRPKFIPGRLPSLPSERILMADALGFGDDEATPDRATLDAEMKNEVAPTELMDVQNGLAPSELMDIENGEDTIKARDSQQYPRRADSLFKLSNDKINLLPDTTKHTTTEHKTNTSELTQFTSDSANMDPNSTFNFTNDGAAEPAKTGDYASLDAKLKALDKQVKASKKPASKSKKRKSGAKDDENFRPDAVTDDDAEWQEANATPKKKRKSTGKLDSGSPQGPANRTRGNAGKQSSPKAKKPANGPAQVTKGAKQDTSVKAAAESDRDEYSDAEGSDAVTGAAELDEVPAGTSIDSQGQSLEPLYEEEETSLIHPNGEPSKSTAEVAPALYFGARSRSRSPHKRTGSVQLAVEETLLMRAAEAALGRRGRSASPAPGLKMMEAVTLETTVVQSTQDAVESVPNGVNGGALQVFTPPTNEQAKIVVTEKTTVEMVRVAGAGGAGEAFEWPEDVF